MALEITTGLAVEINTGQAAWTLTGVMGGLLYGFWTAREDRLINDMVQSGILGGMVMALIGELFSWLKD